MSFSFIEEQFLINNAKNGDTKSYERLIIEYSPKLFRILARITQDNMEAEALVQETFWRTWNALSRYKNDRPFFPYLATVATNLRRDQWRAERRLVDIDLDDFECVLPDSSPGPEEVFEDDELLESLSAAVDQLSNSYRTVISLRYEAQLSYSQISEIMDLPINTVRTLIHRAKQILRDFLERNKKD